ncbi:MAG: ribonuclease HII [Eubacterium sp.]|nr:ribonuclease HII [Eubacterium sp.]
MEKKSIAAVKAEYKEIISLGIMEYETEKEKLQAFVENYKADERSGVVSVLKSAGKRINDIDNETARVKSMMKFEEKYGEDYKSICGVDEVGRGPLAGPVVTAAVILPPGLIIPYLNDSKQVNEKRREELYDIIMEKAVAVSVGLRSEKEIDEMGIAVADSAAMRDSVLGLAVKADMVLVDAFKIPGLDLKQVPIVKGDTLSVSIAAASIIAKVTRDRMMDEYAKQYPEYGFDSNKGYGSAKHIEAIKQVGPCDIHRRSFIGNFT